MNEVEVSRLHELESVIERGLETFVKVGNALKEIRDSRLYRESHPDFEGYCRERWDMTKTYANYQIRAAEVTTIVAVSNEGQARELAPFIEEPETVQAIYAKAESLAENGHPTARDIREVAQEYKPESKPKKQDPGDFLVLFRPCEKYLKNWEPTQFDELVPKQAGRMLETALLVRNTLDEVIEVLNERAATLQLNAK